VLLGPKWHDAADFMQLLALTVLAVPYFQTLHSFSVAIDQPSVLLKLNMIELLLRVPLIVAGLYFFSVFGVLVARCVVTAAMFGCYLLWARKLTGIGPAAQLSNLWKVAVASAAMTACVLVLRHILAPLELSAFVELIATVSAGATTYFIALYGCGVRLVLGQGRLQLADQWW